MFVGLFFIVRGAPALLLYRSELDLRDRIALAFYSATELPLVVAITTIAVDGGHMRGSTAAALVGAAIISTLVFPLVAIRLRRGHQVEDPELCDPVVADTAPGLSGPRALDWELLQRGRQASTWTFSRRQLRVEVASRPRKTTGKNTIADENHSFALAA